MARYESRRVEPRRANTKDSWLTIDWGKPQPPSALHGVMDQIAGTILRDRDLIAQGKREWAKAAAIRRARKRKGGSNSKSGSGTSTPRHSNTLRNPKRDPSRRGGRVAAGARKTSGTPGIKGFFGSLFSSKSKSSSGRKRTTHSSSAAAKRSLTRPGQHGSHSTSKARPILSLDALYHSVISLPRLALSSPVAQPLVNFLGYVTLWFNAYKQMFNNFINPSISALLIGAARPVDSLPAPDPA
ncbi:hypothetical protein PIIN_08014 [Serendipita indica DSM 11827]|uniref:Uncharacterized protein n=1 Tax=Serendipita indica (strain DSM 11827) TaxID=1109443 RepID=G4TRW7_SERID|nr:hypothetical protein PIIN_08014 [Serendipita indica DSM 11827]